MLVYIRDKFIFKSRSDANKFVLKIIDIGESYISFLVFKNKIYLPDNMTPRDAAVDLLAEIFRAENNCYVNFQMFFEDKNVNNDEEAENLIRGYIFTIIQNELPKIYKINDPVTFNIYRNIREAVKSAELHTSLFFTDKFIHLNESISENDVIPDKDELHRLIYTNKFSGNVYNLKLLIKDIFEVLSKSKDLSPVVNLNDFVSVIKSILAMEFVSRNGAETELEHLSEKVNIKLILKDIRLTFNDKLNNYIKKNGFSKIFAQCMYDVIDDIERDFCEGQVRQSVKSLTNTYFGNNEFVNQVTYCVEIYETEIAKFLKKEKFVIDRE